MKLAIIEDEIPALEKLERYITKYDSSSEVVARLSSIEEAVRWFEHSENNPDLIFMDIQLADGLSFDIFNQVLIEKPVIFVTAFDEYAIDAFKVNSIDYILKPITFTDVSKALKKYEKLSAGLSSERISTIGDIVKTRQFKDRFLVRLGNHIHSISVDDIALFYAEGRTVFLITNQGKKFILDFKLEDLEMILQPKHFFRVNRTYIVSFAAIKDVLVYTSSRLKITPNVNVEKDIVVSRERVQAFKIWFEGN